MIEFLVIFLVLYAAAGVIGFAFKLVIAHPWLIVVAVLLLLVMQR